MKNSIAERPSIAIAMRKQLDVELLCSHFERSTSLYIELATDNLDMFRQCCQTRRISLAIIDCSFPDRLGLDLGKELAATGKAGNVLFLDGHYSVLRAEQALSAQAAYCSKCVSLRNLTEYVEMLAFNQALDAKLLDELINHQQQFRIDCPETQGLTKRQIEIWTLIGEGLSVADCARRLGIAVSTADNHKSRLMKTLGIKKSTELARLAVRTGLVDL